MSRKTRLTRERFARFEEAVRKAKAYNYQGMFDNGQRARVGFGTFRAKKPLPRPYRGRTK